MRTFRNLIWLLGFGIKFLCFYFVVGLLCCITIVGIPTGLSLFSVVQFVAWPMEERIETIETSGFGMVSGILWAILVGWYLCLVHFIAGAVMCITIIGIPLGKIHFAIAKWVIYPVRQQLTK